MRLACYFKIFCDPTGLAPSVGRGLHCSSGLGGGWGSTKTTEYHTSTGQSADGQTDMQRRGARWQSGKTQKLRHSCMRGGKEERDKLERNRDFQRRDFKGLREQMANCTRVSQPGSKSVLCIRTGAGDGGGGPVDKGREGAMEEAGQCDQALRACHWATLVRGRASMSFQCFTSAGPLFHDR